MTKAAPSTDNASIESSRQRNQWVYLSDAIETVLSLGDFQKRSAQPYSISDFSIMALEGMDKIAPFDASAIFTIDENTSDLALAAVKPATRSTAMEAQIDYLIDGGTVAWAIRERRGITVLSQDGKSQLFLHVIATYARIRGLFIGVLPSRPAYLPDGALELLSLFLRSVATSLESISYIDLLGRRNQALQKQVDEKMRLLLRHERELANTRKLNAIASLAGGIAHEYNNTLMSLMGYCDLAKMDLEAHPKTLNYLTKTEPVLERMTQLTNQLLAYSRGGKYRKQSVDLSALVNKELSRIKGHLGEGMHVGLTIADADASEGSDQPEGGLFVEGDINQLRQALKALITNAWEALGADGHIDVRLRTISADELPEESAPRLAAGAFVLLEIEDDGCGMDQETAERMFEPFFSTKFAGRGLSLAAVYGIIENHNGAIAVDSRVGCGTTLQLYLPVQPRDSLEGPPVHP